MKTKNLNECRSNCQEDCKYILYDPRDNYCSGYNSSTCSIIYFAEHETWVKGIYSFVKFKMYDKFYLNVTIHHNYYLTWCILGIFGQNTLTPIGTCTSWNGKDCTDDDTVDVGDGPGSCNSDMDCPCCAPFCSSIGKHCQKTIMWTKRIKVIRWAFYLLSLNVI